MRIVLAAVASLCLAAPAIAQTPQLPPATDAGVIWWGKQSGVGLADVAKIAAPVLWFASDEPLLAQGDRVLPSAHPCDAPSSDPVVYYQVTRINLRSKVRVAWPPQDDPFFLDRVENFTIRYHFYFKRHFGNEEREHDLAAADVDLSVDPMAGGGYRVRMTRVAGLVRGTEWYANELEVGPGTRLPITILIERGTHATAPDRNADGILTVGYDINRRTGDAWGVRDLEAGSLMAGRFDMSMFTPRQRGFRMLPPDVPRNGVDGTNATSLWNLTGELGRYELRAASSVPACTNAPSDFRTLRVLMRDQRFGPDFEPTQSTSQLMKDLRRPFSGTDPLIRNFSVRRDRTTGGAFLFRGINFQDGSLMPRFTFDLHRISLEGLYTTTGARAQSWYVSAGTENNSGKWDFAAETGLKLRTRLRGGPQRLTLGAEFLGFRVGIRATGYDRLVLIRWIMEVGIGGW